MERKITVKVLSRAALAVFIYILIYYFFIGINTIPSEGDSIDYHIPIANNIASGNYFNLEYYKMPQYFYPAVGETVLSFFIFLKIPLNLFNVLGVAVLSLVLLKLGLVFGLKKSFSLLFSLSVCTLGTVTRWLDTQIIDIWLLVFFSVCLMLLEQKKRDVKEYFYLGLSFGLLVGTKYTGFLYGGALFLVYLKSVLEHLTLPKVLAFILPFSFVGAIWYARNFVVKANPFYPVDNPLFKGDIVFQERVWQIILRYPVEKLNAFFSEYKLWFFSIFVFPIFLRIRSQFNELLSSRIYKLCLTGLINLVFYMSFVSSHQEWIMVSVMRYAYPVFLPLILSVFLIAQEKKWEAYLSFVVFMGMILFNSFSYHPKLLLLLVPVSFMLFYVLDKKGYK